MSLKKRGLGRGLDALLSSQSAAEPQPGDELKELPLSVLVPGKHQPRRHFDESALAQLAESLKSQGVVQPLVVRPQGSVYEIVAGERRWRAAKLAGLATVPVLVRALSERDAMTVALIENIQRADLNPLEEADALRRLIEDCGLTHEQCAQAVGRSRAHVSNLLRLADLAPSVQQQVREGLISLGHAKVLLGAAPEDQPRLAERVIAQGLSVRQTEALLKARPGPKVPPRKAEPELERRLSSAIGMPVRIKPGAGARGTLEIRYRDAAELQRLLGLFEG